MRHYTCLLLFILASFTGYAGPFIEGADYEVLYERPQTNKYSTATVIEFFSFGCPWCYKLEPALQRWLKQRGNKIAFKKMPVIFHPDWAYYAKAYYVANALALNATLQPALFKAILKDKRDLHSNQAMIDFFIQQGVSPIIAKSAFTHSPEMEMAVQNSQAQMARYHIAAVPAFIINHRFKTDLQRAKTETRLFAILDFLLTQKGSTT